MTGHHHESQHVRTVALPGRFQFLTEDKRTCGLGEVGCVAICLGGEEVGADVVFGKSLVPRCYLHGSLQDC